MNNRALRILGWTLPVFCMAAASFVTYGQWSRLQTATLSGIVAQEGLLDAREELALARRKVSVNSLHAAAEPKKEEETEFLDDLRRRAALAGVRVARWKSSLTPATSREGVVLRSNDALLSEIDRVSSQLVLEGPYDKIRAFLGQFAQSSRLYTVSDINWTRLSTGTETSLTLTVARYVVGRPLPPPVIPIPPNPS